MMSHTAARTRANRGADTVGNRRTVLIVEDDTAVRDVLAMFLQDAGYRVDYAPDGDTALRLLEQDRDTGRFGLVLLDLVIPTVDGLGVLQHLAQNGPVVPVVAMSVSALHLRHAAVNGALEIVQKPFAIEEIMAVVARCCPLPDRGPG